MAHKHNVYDSDAHFSINPMTRQLKNESLTKTVLIQRDHNSERFTFEIPRYVEQHDMSICDIVEIHYLNIDSTTNETKEGVYTVRDLQIAPDDENVVIGSWLISQNATQYVGTLHFLIRFVCSTDGVVDYIWNTAIFSGISISSGIYNGEVIVEEYADVLVDWRNRLEAIALVDFEQTKTSTADGGTNTWTATFADGRTRDFNVKNGSKGSTGQSVTVKTVSESNASGGSNVVTFSDNKTLTVKNGKDGKNGQDPYEYAKSAGYTGTEEEFAKKLILGEGNNYVTAYGAKGDGSTDDTKAFQDALAENRTVFVPGGTYVLSGELIIRANCGLELSQDTVLKFTQTDKNCISMLRSASIKGNHATIFVPYTFGANVINCDTEYDEDALEFDRTLTGDDYKKAIANANNIAVPPFTKWDPQLKMTRYVTDINICKPDNRGFLYSKNGDCYGTGVYLHCNAEDYVSYMWGVSMSGVRIAGGFNYGIRIYNIGETASSWNHDMRIEAVMDACKIGVSVENCRYARLAVTVQPRESYSDAGVYAPYAEHGIELKDSRGVDLSSSRVWDWTKKNNATGKYITLFQPGGQYQHIALYGECMGLVLDDYLYFAQSTYEIRELIYTDTQSNFDSMVILQEPFTKYFKPIEGEPYFTTGTTNKKLMTDDALDDYFNTDTVKGFSDVLSTATDGNGNIYNDIGYIKRGYYVVASTGALATNTYSGCTGYIPIKPGETLYVKGIVIPEEGNGQASFVIYDANYSRIMSMATNNVGFYNQSGYYFAHIPLDDGFAITVQSNPNTTNTAYIRFGFQTVWVTGDVIMAAINEEIKYTVEGFLADGVKVKGGNIIVSSANGKSFRLIADDSGNLSTQLIE